MAAAEPRTRCGGGFRRSQKNQIHLRSAGFAETTDIIFLFSQFCIYGNKQMAVSTWRLECVIRPCKLPPLSTIGLTAGRVYSGLRLNSGRPQEPWNALSERVGYVGA